MTENEADLEKRLIGLLPADGKPATNRYLREKLGIDDHLYWKVRDNLREQGRVIRMPGRGGRTALVVADEEETEEPLSKWWGHAQRLTYILASATGALGILLGGYLLITSGLDLGSGSLALSLVFGAVSLFATGVAVNIYRIQAAQRVEDNYDQARMNRRQVNLLEQAARSSSESRDFLMNMKPAEVAAAVPTGGDDENTSVDAGVGEDDVPSPTSVKDGDIISKDDGIFYRPSAIPLRVLADLVGWWRGPGGSTGGWTVENLVGGYRPYDKDRGLRGVPWFLVFRSSSGETKAYRISYSGRAKIGGASPTPSVSRYSEVDRRWDSFNQTAATASWEH